MQIYTGPKSAYGRKHGVYCPGPGVNVKTARCILNMIDRELKSGWTYDHGGRRIKMTPRLAAKRANYLIALAKKHHGREEARRVAEVVRNWLAKRGLAREAAVAVARWR
jgi:hypothetical protein